MYTILLLTLSLINNQVSWSIQARVGCFYLSTVLKLRSQIYNQQIKAILSVKSQTQWSILCVLMYQSKNCKNHTHQTDKSVIWP